MFDFKGSRTSIVNYKVPMSNAVGVDFYLRGLHKSNSITLSSENYLKIASFC